MEKSIVLEKEKAISQKVTDL